MYAEGGMIGDISGFLKQRTDILKGFRLGNVDELTDMMVGSKALDPLKMLSNLGLQAASATGESMLKLIGGGVDLADMVAGAGGYLADKGPSGIAEDLGKAEDFVKSGKLTDTISNIDFGSIMDEAGASIKEGVETGDIFTSLSSFALDAAVGAGGLGKASKSLTKDL